MATNQKEKEYLAKICQAISFKNELEELKFKFHGTYILCVVSFLNLYFQDSSVYNQDLIIISKKIAKLRRLKLLDLNFVLTDVGNSGCEELSKALSNMM